MIIHKPSFCTKLDVWAPRYSDAYGDSSERCALLAKYKVDMASPVIIINFTRAKHLEGQRFAITREKVRKCGLTTNGKIECYAVPMSYFECWETAQEVADLALNLFPD